MINNNPALEEFRNVEVPSPEESYGVEVPVVDWVYVSLSGSVTAKEYQAMVKLAQALKMIISDNQEYLKPLIQAIEDAGKQR